MLPPIGSQNMILRQQIVGLASSSKLYCRWQTTRSDVVWPQRTSHSPTRSDNSFSGPKVVGCFVLCSQLLAARSVCCEFEVPAKIWSKKTTGSDWAYLGIQ